MTYPMICVDCQNIIRANHANSNIFLICNPCELQHKRHTASSTESASSSKASHGFGSSMANDTIWMKRCKEGIHVFLEAFCFLMFLVPSESEQKRRRCMTLTVRALRLNLWWHVMALELVCAYFPWKMVSDHATMLGGCMTHGFSGTYSNTLRIGWLSLSNGTPN